MSRESLYLICTVCVILGATGFLQAGLVAKYSLEDDLSVTTAVINSITTSGWGSASAHGDISSGVSGIVGNAFLFDAAGNSEYINTNNPLMATSDFTISGWVKIEPLSSAEDSRRVLLGQYATGEPGRMLFYSVDGRDGRANAPRFFLNVGAASLILLGNNAIDDSSWHHLAVTRAANTFTLYVDGVVNDSGSISGASVYQGVNLTIANLSPSELIAADDIIDEVAIYDNALSASEIQAIYQAQNLVVISGADGGLEVSEGQYGDSYSMSLSQQPTADVTITVTSSDSDIDFGAGPGVAESLTFTISDWDVPQSVLVSTTDDALDKGDRNAIISHVISSSDQNYNGSNADSVLVKIYDNDVADVVFYDISDIVVSEVGVTSDMYSLSLMLAPSSDVTVSIVTSDDIIAVPSQLIFTASNWDIAQSVTVTAVADNEIEDSVNVELIAHNFSSNDSGYDGMIRDIVAKVYDANCGSWGYHAGDINHDCQVDFKDLALMAITWMECSDPEDTICSEAGN